MLESLVARVRERWGGEDPELRVTGSVRPDGLFDLKVTSRIFEGKDGLEREAFFWQTFRDLPRETLVRMTYCLMQTPEEAGRLQTE